MEISMKNKDIPDWVIDLIHDPVYEYEYLFENNSNLITTAEKISSRLFAFVTNDYMIRYALEEYQNLLAKDSLSDRLDIYRKIVAYLMWNDNIDLDKAVETVDDSFGKLWLLLKNQHHSNTINMSIANMLIDSHKRSLKDKSVDYKIDNDKSTEKDSKLAPELVNTSYNRARPLALAIGMLLSIASGYAALNVFMLLFPLSSASLPIMAGLLAGGATLAVTMATAPDKYKQEYSWEPTAKRLEDHFTQSFNPQGSGLDSYIEAWNVRNKYVEVSDKEEREKLIAHALLEIIKKPKEIPQQKELEQ